MIYWRQNNEFIKIHGFIIAKTVALERSHHKKKRFVTIDVDRCQLNSLW